MDSGAGLLAHLVTCKYADYLPLYRLEGIVARSGVSLSRSTLCDWMAAAAGLWGPLIDLMRERLLLSRVIHSDDKPVPFLERGRDKARDGHLWVYIGDRDRPYMVFDFTTHYRRDGPEQFLKGYAGYLQADALAQYGGLFTTGEVVHVACNAHARRRFVEAQASAPQEAEEALKYIRRLYKVERELADRYAADDNTGRQQYRSAQTAAVREEFHAWLAVQQARSLPKSPLGEAVGYALSNWQALMRYTEQGYLAIDNNLSERMLRQVVVGRGNWQFCGRAEGGRTAAALYSVAGTCKHLGIDPFAYLHWVLQPCMPCAIIRTKRHSLSGYRIGGTAVTRPTFRRREAWHLPRQSSSAGVAPVGLRRVGVAGERVKIHITLSQSVGRFAKGTCAVGR
jgi:hypothetical protein